MANGQTVTYGYDPVGRLASKTINGVTTQFLNAGQDVVADIGPGGTVDYLNGPGVDEKLSQSGVGGPLYFLQDHLGSTIALTNAVGSVVEREQYEPFGFGSGSALTRFGFTGRERDADTGLLYYRARWYDAQQGRFLSEDPAGLAGGSTNAYTYANDDPVDARDPSGQVINLATAAIGAGIGAVAGAGLTTVSSLVFSGHLPTLAEVGRGAVGGAITGGLIGFAGPLAAPLAASLGGGITGAFGAGAIIGGVAGAAGGAAGQGVANLIDPCHPGSIGNAALWGGLTGAALNGAGSAIAQGLSAAATTTVEDTANAANTAEQASTAGENGNLTEEPTSSDLARTRQGNQTYPGVDSFNDTSLQPGDRLVQVNNGRWFGSLSEFEASGGTAEEYYNSVQLNSANGYAPGVTVYEVTTPTSAATGQALANP